MKMQSLRNYSQQITPFTVRLSRVKSHFPNPYICAVASQHRFKRSPSSTAAVTGTNRHRAFLPSIRSKPCYRMAAMSSQSETNFVPGITVPYIPKIPVGDVNNNDGNNHFYFPVNRIYCVGKNYSDHVKEMGGNPRNEAPCFFMKPSNAIVPCGRCVDSNKNSPAAQIIYPLGTNNLHYEVELVVAIGTCNTDGGTNDGVTNLSLEDASKIIYGYGIGIDLTRRDIQSLAKKNGLPWCTSKGFDSSAPISNIYPITISQVYETLHLPLMKSGMIPSVTNDESRIDESTKLWLKVNGQLKQTGCPIREMIWSVPEIISQLSQLYTLRSGDIIFTGTPAGVSSIIPNDTIQAGMNVLGALEFVVQPRDPVTTTTTTTSSSSSS